jgi:hypothetical protein
MIDDFLNEELSKYGINQADIKFLRHNENRTYRVNDLVKSNSYLFRVHQPSNRKLIQATVNYLRWPVQLTGS